MKMYCVLLSVIFLMSPVAMVVSVGSSMRYYENGTSVTCLGIVCPLDEIFVPCTNSLGDGKHDTCEPCPSDRPRTLGTFDSSAFEYPPVDFVCKSVRERCECAEEAELVNPSECTKTLVPVCKCNTTAGYYGQDPNACQLSENKQCKLPGYELKQDGSCDECPGDKYKNLHQFGRCLLQPRCHRPLVIDDPGDSAHRRTCKLPVTTPPPDKRVTTRESTSPADIEYSTLSYSTLNVTASTNQTSPLLDSTNFEWIYMYLVPVVVVVAVVLLIVVFCVSRRKNKNRRQNINVKDYQPVNSGNTLKPSGRIEKFKIKFFRGFKGCEKAKITTTNEEKNNVDGDQTPAKVNGDQTPAKVNDDETATKLYEAENKDSLCSKLDVNSMLSSVKTSSGFVDDMYILEWNPRDDSSSKGFIECTDTSGNRFKSMTIHNGNERKMLLKMKGKGYNFIFVSSSENGQIEPFVQVRVKPVTNNLDLSTFKSELYTLDFSLFEIVQNRPEEDLYLHRHSNESLDPPNHMSLPHSQNQADSGISDTTPAECSNQAGDSLPHLNESSLDQDVDTDED